MTPRIDIERIVDGKDWFYACEQLMFCRLKGKGVGKWNPWLEQRLYGERYSNRDLEVKPRQVGNTTKHLGRGYINTILNTGYEFRLIFHETKTAKRALQNLKIIHENMPEYVINSKTGKRLKFRPEVDTDNVNELRFPKIKSGIMVLPAGKSIKQAEATGRSDCINYGLLSEYEYYAYQRETYDSLSECVPHPEEGGILVIESTPNGQRDMAKRVRDCLQGTSSYKLHFYPWFIHEDYAFEHYPNLPLFQKAIGQKITLENLAWIGRLSSIEQDLVNTYKVKASQLAWRRWKISDKGGDAKALSDFNRQYPVNINTCFEVTEGSYFNQASLAIYKNLITTPRTHAQQGVNIFRDALPDEQFILSSDTAGGGVDGCACSGSILSRSNWEQVVHIYGRWRPDEFTKILCKYGELYNWAMQIPENVGLGLATCLLIEEYGYPNIYYHTQRIPGRPELKEEIGFPTNSEKQKTLLFTDLEQETRKQKLIIRSEITLQQMYTIVWDERGRKAVTLSGCPDDAVLDIAIGVQGLKTPVFTSQAWDLYSNKQQVV